MHCENVVPRRRDVSAHLGGCIFCLFAVQRMKFVDTRFSGSGYGTEVLAASMQRISQAMFFPRVRMVCMPSRSCLTSSGVLPKTPFQYWELTLGIWAMVKYLFRRSNVVTLPARRQLSTAAAGLKAYLWYLR
jgi:hypothetical protein